MRLPLIRSTAPRSAAPADSTAAAVLPCPAQHWGGWPRALPQSRRRSCRPAQGRWRPAARNWRPIGVGNKMRNGWGGVGCSTGGARQLGSLQAELRWAQGASITPRPSHAAACASRRLPTLMAMPHEPQPALSILVLTVPGERREERAGWEGPAGHSWGYLGGQWAAEAWNPRHATVRSHELQPGGSSRQQQPGSQAGAHRGPGSCR